MSESPQDPAGMHLEAIYLLIEHLQIVCPDRYDDEMERRVQNLNATFLPFRGPQTDTGSLRDVLHGDSLGHNYMVAQCSVLLRFVQEVRKMEDDLPLLRSAADKLWRELAKIYRVFFCESPPFSSEVGS